MSFDGDHFDIYTVGEFTMYYSRLLVLPPRSGP
jgi:hypothetical protein